MVSSQGDGSVAARYSDGKSVVHERLAVKEVIDSVKFGVQLYFATFVDDGEFVSAETVRGGA